MKLAVVYDNTSLHPHLASKWGFSCLVGDNLLFDTGGDGRTLLSNMEKMGIDPVGIEAVALSHAHGDHTGGLRGLLDAGACPTVYVPTAFPASFKKDVRSRAGLVEVDGPLEILPGIYTTGPVGRRIVEQALVVETEKGMVVITGCAHPGVVEMVRSAVGARSLRPYLVLGGFHLGSTSQRHISTIITEFRDLGVQKVAPCHCTGDRAIGMFASEFGDDYLRVGTGLVITIGSKEGGSE